jgi:hypothetical protein
MTSANFLPMFSEYVHTPVVIWRWRLRRHGLRVLRLAIGSILTILCPTLFTTAAGAQLSVGSPQQNTQDVNVGANVVFRVQVAGQSGTPQYYWQFLKDGGSAFVSLNPGDFGGRIAGLGTDTLYINDAQPQDSGRYRCLVRDSTRQENSGPGVLDVTTSLPFTITAPTVLPPHMSAGLSAMLTVSISGQSGTLAGGWQFSSDPARGPFVTLQEGLQSSGSTISDPTQTVLQISNAQGGDTGRYRYVVSDTAGTTTNTHNSGPGHLTVTQVPDFIIEDPIPPSSTVTQGGSVTATIRITPVDGFTGMVSLSASQLPNGVVYNFNPPSTATTSILTLTASGTATTGPATILITGNSGNLSAMNTLDLTVNPATGQDFTISSSPNAVTISPGNSGTSTITVNPLNGFADAVSLAVTSALPGGVTATFGPRSTTTASMLTFMASPTAQTGTTSVTITGTSSPATGSLVRNTTISLTVSPSASSGITLQPSPTIVGLGKTAVFNVAAPGATAYLWKFSSTDGDPSTFMTLQDNSVFYGSAKPELEIANVQSNNVGYYFCAVTIGGVTMNSNIVKLTATSSLMPMKPDFGLQELYSLIQNGTLLGSYDWQAELTEDGLNPWGNGENKSVVAAAIALFYGPKLIVQNRYTGNQPVEVDYRCWWQTFLEDQTGLAPNGHRSSGGVSNFKGSEIGSFDYGGKVDTAVAAADYWTSTAEALFLQSAEATKSPSCLSTGAAGTVAGIQNAAYSYLRDAVGLYALTTGNNPQSDLLGITDTHGTTSTLYSQHYNPPLPGPYVALAGQRTLPGYWGDDQRQPIFCLALNLDTACDPFRPQPGEMLLLAGPYDPMQSDHWKGPLAPTLKGLLSPQDFNNLTSFIHDQPGDPTMIMGPFKTATRLDILGWPGVRASCMDRINTNSAGGAATTGVVYWGSGNPNRNSSTTEVDFLYRYTYCVKRDQYGHCIQSATDGGVNCRVNQNGNNYELDGFDGTFGASDYMLIASIPMTAPSSGVFHYMWDSNGMHTLSTVQAAIPTASPAAGVYSAGQSVALSDATSGATIYYTTDGSVATSSSTIYTAPIAVSTATTINALASAQGFENSGSSKNVYILKVAPPAFSLAAGTYTGSQTVTLSDATPGVTIYYTTDGSMPTTSSPVYGGAISIGAGSTTINALATAPSFFNSDVASATYVIHLPPPTISSISPTRGSTGGGTAITVTGTNFVSGAMVTFAGAAGTGVNVVSSTQLTVASPGNSAAATVTVVVANPDSQTGTLANSFSYFIPMNNISWVKPSGVSWGPANTLTVDGSVLNGPSPVQTVWRDVTVNAAWNTIAVLSTPDGGGGWANTIPTSNYCHSYDVYANYLNVSSPMFHYVGIGSPYCSETAYVNWIEPPSLAGFGPAGSLVVQGNATGAPAGTTVAFYWSDVTAGTGWNQTSSATPDASGNWYNYIPNVTSWHQYSVYAIYDAFDTRNAQGACTYSANGGTTWCPR